jgi:UDPglucose--hexose-1-phosphate uridylyltransferase
VRTDLPPPVTSEIRVNPVTGRAVLIAPQRAGRFVAGSLRDETIHPPQPPHDPTCPFCLGQEAHLERLVHETPSPIGEPWQARVVHNKFPILAPLVSPMLEGGVAGRHEVVIESPRHDADIATLSAAERYALMCTYRDRLRALWADPKHQTVVMFRNRGAKGGATLAHPHGQIVAPQFAPSSLIDEEARTLADYRLHGVGTLARMLATELAAGLRIVEADADHVAFVPHAAEVPGELWIVPRSPQAGWWQLADGAIERLGNFLARQLNRIRARMNDPDYCFAVIGATRAAALEPWAHWRLVVYPRLHRAGGFELATGIAVNSSRPEAAAADLRRDAV